MPFIFPQTTVVTSFFNPPDNANILVAVGFFRALNILVHSFQLTTSKMLGYT